MHLAISNNIANAVKFFFWHQTSTIQAHLSIDSDLSQEAKKGFNLEREENQRYHTNDADDPDGWDYEMGFMEYSTSA